MSQTDRAAARPATISDRDRVVGILSEAFAGDPVWGNAFGGPERAAGFTAWFTPLVEQATEDRSLWVTADCEAAALWIYPGEVELTEPREQAMRSELTALYPDRGRRIFEAFDAFEAALPSGDFYYLSLLGTADRARGHGLGMALLRQHLDWLDTQGARAYLESTNPVNLARYAAVGFEAGAEFIADGRTVTTMWRQPSRRTSH